MHAIISITYRNCVLAYISEPNSSILFQTCCLIFDNPTLKIRRSPTLRLFSCCFDDGRFDSLHTPYWLNTNVYKHLMTSISNYIKVSY
jgi:hypothetical protein